MIAYQLAIRAKTSARWHNAKGFSYEQVAEQSNGQMYHYIGPKRGDNSLNGFHGFANLGPKEVATFDFSQVDANVLYQLSIWSVMLPFSFAMHGCWTLSIV